jgi:hypothetical protein
LYHGNYGQMEKCPNCDSSRHKNNADFHMECVATSNDTKREIVGKISAGAQVEVESSIRIDTMSQRKVPTMVM